jgi:hypothetical protein
MFSYVVPPPHIGWRVEVLVKSKVVVVGEGQTGQIVDEVTVSMIGVQGCVTVLGMQKVVVEELEVVLEELEVVFEELELVLEELEVMVEELELVLEELEMMVDELEVVLEELEVMVDDLEVVLEEELVAIEGDDELVLDVSQDVVVLVVVVIVTTVTVVGIELVDFEWVGVVEEGVDVV